VEKNAKEDVDLSIADVVAGTELGHGVLIGEVPDGFLQLLVHNHLEQALEWQSSVLGVVWLREERKILAGKGPLLPSVFSLTLETETIVDLYSHGTVLLLGCIIILQ
jgi:hypothetical protein